MRKVCYVSTVDYAWVVGIVVCLETIAQLTDVWRWTALIEPKLALAHKISGL